MRINFVRGKIIWISSLDTSEQSPARGENFWLLATPVDKIFNAISVAKKPFGWLHACRIYHKSVQELNRNMGPFWFADIFTSPF